MKNNDAMSNMSLRRLESDPQDLMKRGNQDSPK